MNRYQGYVCMIYKIISHFGIISKRNNDLTALSSQTDRQTSESNKSDVAKRKKETEMFIRTLVTAN
jgi:hypothetical protein